MQSRLILTSILDVLLNLDHCGQFSVSWEYSPRSGLGLTALKKDGTVLFSLKLGLELLRELRSRLVSDPTGAGKPST
jgi:hypothetical protein